MDFVLNMPVALTIPSGLTFFGRDDSIWDSLAQMIDTQFKWNKQSGNIRQMGLTVHRMLRMEDIEDAIETKLLNDTISRVGVRIVASSIEWCNLHGMNLPHLL